MAFGLGAMLSGAPMRQMIDGSAADRAAAKGQGYRIGAGGQVSQAAPQNTGGYGLSRLAMMPLMPLMQGIERQQKDIAFGDIQDPRQRLLGDYQSASYSRLRPDGTSARYDDYMSAVPRQLMQDTPIYGGLGRSQLGSLLDYLSIQNAPYMNMPAATPSDMWGQTQSAAPAAPAAQSPMNRLNTESALDKRNRLLGRA